MSNSIPQAPRPQSMPEQGLMLMPSLSLSMF